MSDEKIGYKNPPTHRRFSKGKSGNPKGRPRKNSEADAENLLHRKLLLEVNGKSERVPAIEAVGLKLLDSALKGNRRAARTLLNKATTLGLEKIVPEQGITYVKADVTPENSDALLLALGALKKVPDEYNAAGDHQGPYRLELWFFEEALKRSSLEKIDRYRMDLLAHSTADPEGAMLVFERLGFGKFSLKDVARRPQPPKPQP